MADCSTIEPMPQQLLEAMQCARQVRHQFDVIIMLFMTLRVYFVFQYLHVPVMLVFPSIDFECKVGRCGPLAHSRSPCDQYGTMSYCSVLSHGCMSHDDVQGNNVNVLSWNFLAMYFLANHAGEFFFLSFWGIIVWCATPAQHAEPHHGATFCNTMRHIATHGRRVPSNLSFNRAVACRRPNAVRSTNAPCGCPTSAHILAAALRTAMPSSHRQRRFAAYSGPWLSSP